MAVQFYDSGRTFDPGDRDLHRSDPGAVSMADPAEQGEECRLVGAGHSSGMGRRISAEGFRSPVVWAGWLSLWAADRWYYRSRAGDPAVGCAGSRRRA